MLGEIILHDPGRELVMKRRVDMEEDLYLADHTIGGREASKIDPDQHGLPVQPMTFSLELMAEAASVLVPGKVVIGMKEIRLSRWLPYDVEPVNLGIKARLLSPAASALPADGQVQVFAEILDLGTTSAPLEKGKTAVEGIVILDNQYPAPPLEASYHPINEQPCTLSLEVLYKNLFHGPRLEGVVSTGRIGDNGIESVVRVLPLTDIFRSTREPRLILDPILMDVAMHPLAAWHLAQPDQTGRIVLPIGVERLEIFGPPPPTNTQLLARGKVERITSRQFVHGVELLWPDGRLIYRLRSARYWRFYLPFGKVNFHGPKDEYFLSREYPIILPPAVAGPAATPPSPPSQGGGDRFLPPFARGDDSSLPPLRRGA